MPRRRLLSVLAAGPLADRLESWKEIAAFLGRSVRTVQRWEREEGLPAHRHAHGAQDTVYAFRSEIAAWRSGRNLRPFQPGSIVESCDDAIVGMTREGVIVTWNAGAARLYGYEAPEVVGRPVSLLSATGEDDTAPLRALVLRGERAEARDASHARQDGSRVDVSIVVSPVRDGRGRVVGVSCVSRDMTEHRAAERQRLDQLRRVQAAEAHLLAVGDVTAEPLLTCDRGGRLTYANRAAAERFGVAREVLVGRCIATLLPPRHRAALHAAIRLFVETGRANAPEFAGGFAGLHADGSEFPAELSLRGFTTGEGPFLAALVRPLERRAPRREDGAA